MERLRTPFDSIRIRRALGCALALGSLLAGPMAFSCGRESTPAAASTAEAKSAAPPASAAPQAAPLDSRARRERGRKLYLSECSGCHGERGRADGPAAVAIDPKPRDFVAEAFKFRSTPSGERPRVGDIVDGIGRGMPGSAMPAFRHLSQQEKVWIAEYVLHLARLDEVPEPPPVVLAPATPETGSSIAHGREVFQRLQCEKCHGPEGRGDGPSAAALKDAQGRAIAARDLTRGQLRRGDTVDEIVRTLLAGIDGTPMPSYGSSLEGTDACDLARFILSWKRPEEPLPSDALARGRAVVERRQCFACHVIEGRGGRVGPSLDVSSKKLRFDWVKQFLADPRAAGKLYPFTPWRMPDLGLSTAEIEGILALFAEISARPYPEPAVPLATVNSEAVAKGQLLYVLKCAECHNLGNVIPTPEAKRQGPDLIHVSRRLRFEWIPEWVRNPVNVYPGTSMVNSNLSPEEIDQVRAFLWNVSTRAPASN